ncbi:MAG TPA: class D sortase [Candidatus Saccharimonadales bacterium]|nr:class D sortase [Candidatus Saccharimonadales bacterium]
MSEAKIVHFPHHKRSDSANNPDAAEHARARIAALPDQYASHASPRPDLARKIPPASPAAQDQPLSSEIPGIDDLTEIGRQLKGGNSQEAPEGQPSESPQETTTKKRRLPSQAKPLISAAVTFVIIFMVFKAPIFLTQLSYATQKPPVTAPSNNSTAVGPDPVIDIAKINVHAPIAFAHSNTESDIQKDLEGGVVHYANTALPGTTGNSVIFGHSSNDWWEPGNYKFVFVLLDKLAVGDTFTINYNSKQYLYKVAEVKVVEPTDLSVLNQTSDAEVTLITCTPPGTSWKRLIVRANQTTPVTQKSAPVQPEKHGILPSNAPGIVDSLGRLWNSVVNLFSTDK